MAWKITSLQAYSGFTESQLRNITTLFSDQWSQYSWSGKEYDLDTPAFPLLLSGLCKSLCKTAKVFCLHCFQSYFRSLLRTASLNPLQKHRNMVWTTTIWKALCINLLSTDFQLSQPANSYTNVTLKLQKAQIKKRYNSNNSCKVMQKEVFRSTGTSNWSEFTSVAVRMHTSYQQ